MQTVDTNVLLRILVDDPSNQKQCVSARRWAEQTKHVYIPQVVQIELVWVLKYSYQSSKEDITFILKTVKNNGAFELQRLNIFANALEYYQHHNVDFADCLILAEAEHSATTPVVTFDKK